MITPPEACLTKKITAQDFADILYEAVQGVEIVLQKGDMNGVLITEAANIQVFIIRMFFCLACAKVNSRQ